MKLVVDTYYIFRSSITILELFTNNGIAGVIASCKIMDNF